VRDNLVQKKNPKCPRDLDFIVNSQPERLAMSLKRELGGSIVSLKDETLTRIILKNKDIIDITLLNDNIDRDLATRDYTLNAIAWSPDAGFLDPSGGIRDITSKKIKLISRNNLIDDPLRLIRAYRMSSLTGFQIDSRTRKTIKGLSSLSSRAASERITHELIKIISGHNYRGSLSYALQDGVLGKVTGLTTRRLKLNLDILNQVHRRIGWVSQKWLDTDAGQGIDNKSALRLSALILGGDINKLSFSRTFQRRVHITEQLLQDFSLLRLQDKERLFDVLCMAGDSFVDLSLISGKRWTLDEYRRYVRAKNKPLVSGDELIHNYKIKKGPRVGEILRKIEKARFIGEIRKKTEILDIVSDRVK